MTPRSKAARRPARLALAGLAVALAFGPAAALAQDGEDDGDGPEPTQIVVNIVGPCALTVYGEDLPCRGVAYMVFPATGRIDFAAVTGSAGLSFSGQSDDNEDGQYALAIDSVLDAASDRTSAEGECDMQVSADRRTVESLECRATTDQGRMLLRASGDVVADDGEDDGDD